MQDYEDIPEFYTIYRFPEDIKTVEGKKRFEMLKNDFRKLLQHEWLKKHLDSKDTIKIIDICSGKGIGSIAFASILKEIEKKFDITMIDIRCDALKQAEKNAADELGYKPRTICSNILNIDENITGADIVLMIGGSAAHFSPWDMIRLYATTSTMLGDDGILVIEENDRVYRILVKKGFKDFLPEWVTEKEVIVTVHKGYNWKTGMFTRGVMNLLNPNKVAFANVYFWSLSELMALAWIFYHDVDFVESSSKIQPTGYILAKQPRRKINKNDLEQIPKVLKE